MDRSGSARSKTFVSTMESLNKALKHSSTYDRHDQPRKDFQKMVSETVSQVNLYGVDSLDYHVFEAMIHMFDGLTRLIEDVNRQTQKIKQDASDSTPHDDI